MFSVTNKYDPEKPKQAVGSVVSFPGQTIYQETVCLVKTIYKSQLLVFIQPRETAYTTQI